LKKHFIITAMILLLLTGNAFASGGFKIEYSPSADTVRIEGECKKGFVNITVLPKELLEDAENLDSEQLSGAGVILKTASAYEGILDENITLGENFTTGCYLISVEGAEQCYRRFFVKSVSETVASVASQFKSSADKKGLIFQNLASLGFDSTAFEAYGEKITKQLASISLRETVNAENFADMYLLSEGITLMKKGVITSDKFISLYSGIRGMDIPEMYYLTEKDVKSNFNSILPLQDFTAKEFEKIIDDCFMLARVNVEKTAVKDELVSYIRSAGADMSNYDKLNSYYKGLLFSALTNNKAYTGMDELISEFKAESLKQLKAKEKNETSGGSGGGGGGGGGDFAISDKPAKNETKPEPEKETSFNDIKNHWGKDDIIKMTSSGILNGYEDGSFKPDKSITRAEFVKIVSTLLSLPEKSGNSFSDVDMNKWYAPFVYAASSYGIINGVSADEFAPESSITRQDAAVIIHRILTKKGAKFESTAEFDDGEMIAFYAEQAVKELSGKDIIKGYNGCFRPTDTLTRAETVAMLGRVTEYIK